MTQSGAPGAVEPHFGPAVVVPLPLPTVFPERNYVRVVLVSQFCEGRGWGRIATRARDVPGGLVVGYSGHA